MEIIMRPIGGVVPYEKNPRNNDAAVDAVAASIREFGFKQPIVIDVDGVIVAGHTRLRAAKKLGLTEVPCIMADDLTEEQVKAYRLADNKTAELAEWDLDLLAEELDDILDIDMEGFGFDVDVKPIEHEAIEDNYTESEDIKTRAKRGDVWKLGRHRLMCGDATSIGDIDTLVGGVQIDLVLTDPPYGINANKMTLGTGTKDFYRGGNWDDSVIDVSYLTTLADKACIWGGNYFADVLPVTNDWICWYKKLKNMSFSEFELAWNNYGNNCRMIIHHWSGEKKLHPTMKPVTVMASCIDMCSDNPQNILDVFGGSGSTLIACEQLNRKCYMMELDPHYCDVIIDRWEQFTGEKAELI